MVVRKLALLAFMAVACCGGLAQSPKWPAKPVKFVSPFPPGGSGDTLARLFAAKLTDSLGQQFIVENRPGAAGIVGTDYVAKSPPDGYTWVFVFDSFAVHRALNSRLPFDPEKDFAPVMIVGRAPMVITTGSSSAYKTFLDVVAAAKKRPDSVTVANAGSGTLGHLTTILIGDAAGVQFAPVPYKGGGPMSIDLIGGQVDLAIASTAGQAQFIRSGKMRPLVLTSEHRSASFPDVPTLIEDGYPVSAYAWWAILAPGKTPPEIIAALHREVSRTMLLPDVRRSLTDSLGMEILASEPEEAAKWIRSEAERWGRVVRDKRIQAE